VINTILFVGSVRCVKATVPGAPAQSDLIAALMAALQQHQQQTETARRAYAADIAQANFAANEAEQQNGGQPPLA